ncbi:MAG TPA: class I SAM-dependent rRNA methyltransferase [Verrucomicrobiae bacterium]|jgi:23S rRNA (cytosine1962-C5)-methyltransferase|nr:class I SAM-dependent rRNA methyltransferase [Verrucomicrobiae bacterium]
MVSDKKPALRLRVTAVAETMARKGHPWIFAGSVREQNRDGATGELAVIFDHRDKFLAVGLFDNDSPIRVRVLHAGKPLRIDDAWFAEKIKAAWTRREGMFDQTTTGFRWLNGESDGLPGLVADKYNDTLVLKLYTAAWLPWLPVLLPNFVIPITKFGRVVLRLSRNIQQLAAEKFGLEDGQMLHGESIAGPVVFLENGLRFESDPRKGQKTGFFLDQRENRKIVRGMAHGRRVLNLFSFSGGFSVSAAAGGATETVSLDISEHALAAARRNFELNRAVVGNCRHETIQADAFAWLQKSVEKKYGLIVLDPPSLAKRESERDDALLAYGKLAGAALRRLEPGGTLVACSCSAHVEKEEFFGKVLEAAQETGRRFEEVLTTGHAPDHAATYREGEYLKAIYLTEKAAR